MNVSSVTLRAVEPADVDMLYRLENLPEVWRVGWCDGPLSRQQLWDYINNYAADIYRDRQLQLVVMACGNAVGTVDITDFNPRHLRAQIGVAILPQFRGQGLASAALSQAIAICHDVYGMHQLLAMIPKDNEVSLRLFGNHGFKTAGCLRSWLRRAGSYTDVVLLQRLL